MKIIESTANKTIKERAHLLQKKGRDQSALFLVEGEHLVQEAYKKGFLDEVYLPLDQKFDLDIETIHCSQAVLNKLSSQVSDAQMIGVCHKPSWNRPIEGPILLLDRVQDPGNLGTIVRTAYALGAKGLCLSTGCADLYNPKTIQSSQGAIFSLPVWENDLEKEIPYLQAQGFTVYATNLHPPFSNLQETQKKEPFALVLGNEGSGISNKILELCNHSIKIEMEHFESLNVAMAAGIVLYTLIHQ